VTTVEPAPSAIDALVAEFTAITDRAERAAAITAYGRTRGNLPQPLRLMRDDALRGLRLDENGHKKSLVGWIASRAGVSQSRMSRLLARATSTEGVPS